MITTRRSVLLLVLWASIVAGCSAMGQEKGDLLKGVTFEQNKNEIRKVKQMAQSPPEQSGGNLGLPFSCDSITDKSDKGKEVYAACLSALEENFTYESERLRHRKWVFRYQLIATNVSFVIVMVMIGLGLWFAYIQFSRQFPTLPPTTAPGDSVAPAESTAGSRTEVELGLARIRVSSSILGVIILSLAMGFFYLYIRYVFPISGVQSGP